MSRVDAVFIALLVAIVVAFGFGGERAVRRHEDFNERCHAAGGVPTWNRDDGSHCWAPGTFIDVQPKR